jgi:hypothetical protein
LIQHQLQGNPLQLLSASAASLIDTSSSSTNNPWLGSPLKRSRFVQPTNTPAVQQLLMAASQMRPIQPTYHPFQLAAAKQSTELFHQQLAQQLRFNADNAVVCLCLSL